MMIFTLFFLNGLIIQAATIPFYNVTFQLPPESNHNRKNSTLNKLFEMTMRFYQAWGDGSVDGWKFQVLKPSGYFYVASVTCIFINFVHDML